MVCKLLCLTIYSIYISTYVIVAMVGFGDMTPNSEGDNILKPHIFKFILMLIVTYLLIALRMHRHTIIYYILHDCGHPAGVCHAERVLLRCDA